MGDVDGPVLARHVYEKLFSSETVDMNLIPYAVDAAMRELRLQGISPYRWASFIHMGA
jgi:hypothetical protein